MCIAAVLSACQSAPDVSPHTPQPVSLTDIVTPDQLGNWELQGSISREHHSLRIFRYQYTDPTHPLDISVYPLPSGWAQFGDAGATQRQFGMLSHLIIRSAYQEYNATSVTPAHPVTSKSLTGKPVISSRITTTFQNRKPLVTLLSITLYRHFFVRLTLTVPAAQADTQETALAAARHQLLQYWESHHFTANASR